jgi:hypothetical protein
MTLKETLEAFISLIEKVLSKQVAAIVFIACGIALYFPVSVPPLIKEWLPVIVIICGAVASVEISKWVWFFVKSGFCNVIKTYRETKQFNAALKQLDELSEKQRAIIQQAYSEHIALDLFVVDVTELLSLGIMCQTLDHMQAPYGQVAGFHSLFDLTAYGRKLIKAKIEQDLTFFKQYAP